MAKLKALVMDILEQYEDGIGIKAISDTTGLPPDVVFDILQRYSDMVVEGDVSTTVQ